MAIVYTDDQNYTDIADAIRAKNGSADTYTPDEMAIAISALPSNPAKGLVFSDYDNDGYPHKAEFVGSWTSIPSYFCKYAFNLNNFGKLVTEITIPEGVTSVDQASFGNSKSLKTVNFPTTLVTLAMESFLDCTNLESVNLENTAVATIGTSSLKNTKLTAITFPSTISTFGTGVLQGASSLKTVTYNGKVLNITNNCFYGCTAVETYDFSHATSIPTLYSTASLGHKANCVIKIPLALSDTTLGTGNGWESSGNWASLTDVVWTPV